MKKKNILCGPDALGCKERVALVLDYGGAREGVLGAVGQQLLQLRTGEVNKLSSS